MIIAAPVRSLPSLYPHSLTHPQVEFFDLLIKCVPPFFSFIAADAGRSLTRVLHAILCCRVILHLRQAAVPAAEDSEGGWSSAALSTLRFKMRLRRTRRTDDSFEMSTVRDSTVHDV